jgi:hypothetical protein
LRVVVYDSLHPRLQATADVRISVTRNPFAPQFIPTADYPATVQENVTLGHQVLNINARDNDNVSDTDLYFLLTIQRAWFTILGKVMKFFFNVKFAV